MSEIARIMLDSPEHCRMELERVSNSLSALASEYQQKRGDLGKIEGQIDELRARTLIGTEGANKEEREAKVLVALAEDPDAAPVISQWDELRVEVEILKVRIKALEARGNHAANANNSLTAETKFVGRANLGGPVA